jgi:hypothetical protein
VDETVCRLCRMVLSLVEPSGSAAIGLVGKKCEVKLRATRHAGGEKRYSSYSLSTSELDGVSFQRHASAGLYPRERTTGTHWIGGWVGLRAGLDTGTRGTIPCLCR